MDDSNPRLPHGFRVRVPTPQFARVEKINPPNAKLSDKLVFHIQDIHNNIESQLHIAHTLSQILEKENVHLIALEGAFNEIDLSQIKKHINKSTLHITAKALIDNKYISGPVYTAMTTPKTEIDLRGVDDKNHYARNVESYIKALRNRRQLRASLSHKKIELEKQKQIYFSKELIKFDRTSNSYSEGKTELVSYLKFLLPYAQSSSPEIGNFLLAAELEKRLSPTLIQKDREKLLMDLQNKISAAELSEILQLAFLHKSGTAKHIDFYTFLASKAQKAQIQMTNYAHLDQYLDYLRRTDLIVLEKLFNEMRNIENRTYSLLASSRKEWDLIQTNRNLELTKKLLEFNMTSEEWREYKLCDRAGLTSEEMDLSHFEEFYIEALQRDNAMAQNLIEIMKQKKYSRAVLITGGFHSRGISSALNSNGITVATLTPRLSKLDNEDGSSYLSLFEQEKSPIEKFSIGERLFLARHPAPSHVTNLLIPAVAVGIEELKTKGASSLISAQALFDKLRVRNPNPLNIKVNTAPQHKTANVTIASPVNHRQVQIEIAQQEDATFVIREALLSSPLWETLVFWMIPFQMAQAFAIAPIFLVGPLTILFVSTHCVYAYIHSRKLETWDKIVFRSLVSFLLFGVTSQFSSSFLLPMILHSSYNAIGLAFHLPLLSIRLIPPSPVATDSLGIFPLTHNDIRHKDRIALDSLPDPVRKFLQHAKSNGGDSVVIVGKAVREAITGSSSDGGYDIQTSVSVSEANTDSFGRIINQKFLSYIPNWLLQWNSHIHFALRKFTATLSGKIDSGHTGLTWGIFDGKPVVQKINMVLTTEGDIYLDHPDLTINLMGITADGIFLDPYGGKKDLEALQARFEGPMQKLNLEVILNAFKDKHQLALRWHRTALDAVMAYAILLPELIPDHFGSLAPKKRNQRRKHIQTLIDAIFIHAINPQAALNDLRELNLFEPLTAMGIHFNLNPEKKSSPPKLHLKDAKKPKLVIAKPENPKTKKTSDPFTVEEEEIFRNWMQDEASDQLPPNDLLVRFWNRIVNNWQMHKHKGTKAFQPGWNYALSKKWGVSESNLRTLLDWFIGSRINVEAVSLPTLKIFIEVWMAEYRNRRTYRDSFVYMVTGDMDDETKIKYAIANIKGMNRLFNTEFYEGRTILKTPIEGTPFYLGMRFGFAEGPFGFSILIGRESHSTTDPFKGIFFRIGLDTAGSTLRVITIKGVAGKDDELAIFSKTLGIKAGRALLHVATAFADRTGFARLMGMDENHHPTVGNTASADPLNYRAIFHGFGLRQRSPFGPWQSIDRLRERSRSPGNPEEAPGINAILAAFENLTPQRQRFTNKPTLAHPDTPTIAAAFEPQVIDPILEGSAKLSPSEMLRRIRESSNAYHRSQLVRDISATAPSSYRTQALFSALSDPDFEIRKLAFQIIIDSNQISIEEMIKELISPDLPAGLQNRRIPTNEEIDPEILNRVMRQNTRGAILYVIGKTKRYRDAFEKILSENSNDINNYQHFFHTEDDSRFALGTDQPIPPLVAVRYLIEQIHSKGERAIKSSAADSHEGRLAAAKEAMYGNFPYDFETMFKLHPNTHDVPGRFIYQIFRLNPINELSHLLKAEENKNKPPRLVKEEAPPSSLLYLLVNLRREVAPSMQNKLIFGLGGAFIEGVLIIIMAVGLFDYASPLTNCVILSVLLTAYVFLHIMVPGRNSLKEKLYPHLATFAPYLIFGSLYFFIGYFPLMILPVAIHLIEDYQRLGFTTRRATEKIETVLKSVPLIFGVSDFKEKTASRKKSSKAKKLTIAILDDLAGIDDSQLEERIKAVVANSSLNSGKVLFISNRENIRKKTKILAGRSALVEDGAHFISTADQQESNLNLRELEFWLNQRLLFDADTDLQIILPYQMQIISDGLMEGSRLSKALFILVDHLNRAISIDTLNLDLIHKAVKVMAEQA